MLFRFRSPKLRPDDPTLLRLRPPTGFGDHLMLSAVMDGLVRERPELRFSLVANHPELFRGNPHVVELLAERYVKKRDRALLDRFLHVQFRPPRDRYLQMSGHLIDDMYERVGVPVRHRTREPRIYLTEKELGFRRRLLDRLPRPIVAIVTYGKSSVRLPNKIYPPDQWEELARRLVKEVPTILHLGTRKEGSLTPGARDFRDIGYRNMAGVLQRCDLLVTHVSGVMHLAAAVRTPSVVLYGAAEHPAISGYPWNRNLYVPIDCGPCWMDEPCAHHSCMRRLTPEIVVEEIRTVLHSAIIDGSH